MPSTCSGHADSTTDFLAAIVCFCVWLFFSQPDGRYLRRGWRSEATAKPCHYRTQRKPDWVPAEVIRLKALMPDKGCRKIAQTFNRLYAQRRRMTVGHTYVANIIRRHRYEIEAVRQQVRRRKGRPSRKNRTWGVDLTGKAVIGGEIIPILGIVDHGTRLNLHLEALTNKRSMTLAWIIFKTCLCHGRPKRIRTDNERVFTSRLFRLGLKLFGIRHQTIDLHAPWMNGRIERFFGTLKQKLDRWRVPNRKTLNASLAEFQFWYNQIRPHQSLYGRTPAEVWNGKDIYRRGPKAAFHFEAWDGLLSGFYLPT